MIDKKLITQCEAQFLLKYPMGFDDLRWQELKQRHRDDQILQFFSEQVNIKYIDHILSKGEIRQYSKQLVNTICKSRMISVFEKTALRNFMHYEAFQIPFLSSLKNLLMAYNEKNFNQFSNTLAMAKAQDKRANPCKWPVISVICYYHFSFCYPVKPTTIKKIAAGLNYDIHYSPQVNFQTYTHINQLYEYFREHSKLCHLLPKVYTHAMLYSIFNP